MNILQSNEIYTLPSCIEGRILSVRTESPLDYMLLSLYIHSLEENPLSPIRYLGIEENKPAYGASIGRAHV